jgi:hypothetical protein
MQFPYYSHSPGPDYKPALVTQIRRRLASLGANLYDGIIFTEAMTLFAFGMKLALIGGVIFAIATIVYMSQSSLGLAEQGTLFWAIMASFLLWMVGGIYLGVAGDQWASRRLKYQGQQK